MVIANVSNWGAREWLFILSVISFCIIGTLVQLVYVWRLLKHRRKISTHKAFIARGSSLFVAHCAMNLYWTAIHPLIVGAGYILYRDNVLVLLSLYCYGFVMLQCLMALFYIRC